MKIRKAFFPKIYEIGPVVTFFSADKRILSLYLIFFPSLFSIPINEENEVRQYHYQIQSTCEKEK